MPISATNNKRNEENTETVFSSSSVRLKGLEPPRITPLDPKSSAATNYATAASIFVVDAKIKTKNQACKHIGKKIEKMMKNSI